MNQSPQVIAVALNPTIDRGIEVPNFTIGAHQVGQGVFRRAAGKATNVARAVSVLGVPTVLTGFVGRGQQDDFHRQLDGEYLACDLLPIDGETRENVTIMDPVTRIDTHIRDRGFTVRPADLDALRGKLAAFARPELIVCFSGSLPPGMTADDFLDLIRTCQTRNARVCVDAGGDVLRACTAVKLHLIKPNFAELAEMFATAIKTEQQLLAVTPELHRRAEMSLVSHGPEGAYLVADDVIIKGKVPIDPAEVKNTVGCGDALLGGFLSARLHGRDLPDSLRFALAVATSAATSLLPAEINKDQIGRFLPLAGVRSVQLPR